MNICIEKNKTCKYASIYGYCNKIHNLKYTHETDNITDNILEFIQRRFPKDCNWTDGNCYYFAIILKDRFPEGEIFYDVINSHFVFEYQDRLYDWNGIYKSEGLLVNWKNFDKYDSLLKQRIIRDCIL